MIAEILVGDLGAGDADLEALEIGRIEQRPVGRHHVEAVVPVGEAADAFRLELLEQPLADFALHRLGIGRVVLEQPRQVERLEFLGAERGELRGRRRQHLHRAELQGFDLFLVLEQVRVRIDFDLHLAVGVFLGKFLELQRALALRRVVGDDVAEFDDDRVLRRGRNDRKRERGQYRAQQHRCLLHCESSDFLTCRHFPVWIVVQGSPTGRLRNDNSPWHRNPIDFRTGGLGFLAPKPLIRLRYHCQTAFCLSRSAPLSVFFGVSATQRYSMPAAQVSTRAGVA